MNRVGHAGPRRERLARLVPAATCSTRFAPLARGARRRRRAPRAGATQRSGWRGALEAHGWDGEWYRRAYFDDGTPLGSAAQRRMPDRLDRAELGGALAAPATRSARARRWPRSTRTWCERDAGLVQLLDPPFDARRARPRLHQGLPARRARERRPVHARRVWAVMAFAALGDGDARLGAASTLINPVHHCADAARRRSATRSSPTSSPPTSTRAAARRPRRLDLVHRLGRLDVPRRDRIDARPRRSAATSSSFRPCLPSAWNEAELRLARAGKTLRVLFARQRARPVPPAPGRWRCMLGERLSWSTLPPDARLPHRPRRPGRRRQRAACRPASAADGARGPAALTPLPAPSYSGARGAPIGARPGRCLQCLIISGPRGTRAGRGSRTEFSKC